MTHPLLKLSGGMVRRAFQACSHRLMLGLITGALVVASRAGIGQEVFQERELLWQELTQRSPWVFLGDSNTYSGATVALLEAWLASSGHPKLLNLGVPSETASGLSEVDHPFRRPCVHERLAKVLAMTKPGLVVVSYGMNDGIYQPPNEANFAAYRRGMLLLAQAIRKTGAKLVVLTPPIFEPGPVKDKGKLGPSAKGRYAYFAPAADYDRVLEQQAAWCLTNEMQADLVIDVHAMFHQEKSSLKEDEPSFQFTRDGIHYGNFGHALIAERILSEFGAPQDLLANYPSDSMMESATRKHRILRDAYLSATGKNRPGLPAGLPVWLAEKKASELPVSHQAEE